MEDELTLMGTGQLSFKYGENGDDAVVADDGWDEALPLLTGRVLNRARQECAFTIAGFYIQLHAGT